MRLVTPTVVRSSLLGRLAAILLVVLIVAPVTAPFSTMSGSLEASPGGPADSVKSESSPTDAVVELAIVHHDLSYCVVPFRSCALTARTNVASVHRILRL